MIEQCSKDDVGGNRGGLKFHYEFVIPPDGWIRARDISNRKSGKVAGKKRRHELPRSPDRLHGKQLLVHHTTSSVANSVAAS